MSVSLILGARGAGKCVLLNSRLLGNSGWLSCLGDQAVGMHPFLLSDKADGISTVLNGQRPNPEMKARISFISGTNCSVEENGSDCHLS